MKTTQDILIDAKACSGAVARADTAAKNTALEAMAQALLSGMQGILSANAEDMSSAQGKISEVMLDRLSLNEERIKAMAEGIREVAALPDPVGRVLAAVQRQGMTIDKLSVPMGVVAIIFESRPNVASDAAALAIKSGNACILRCGKEAHASCAAIAECLRDGMERSGFPRNCIQLVEDISRESARELLHARGYIDMLIPRGGAGLIRACVEDSTVPCIETGTGICHIYVDKAADEDMALAIIDNAKTSRPSVCNAAEACLVHRDIAGTFLPRLRQRLVQQRAAQGKPPVELRCDIRAHAIIGGTPACPEDFDTEFLDYIMAVGIVDSTSDAIAHIGAHSTGHSDCIVTGDPAAAELFTRCVDSAAVYVNASTRFTDGGVFGLGCEMGISTQKLHARGPMGLEELTSYKYVIHGSGQIR